MFLYTPKLEHYRGMIEAALPRFLPEPGGPHDTVARAMAYACMDGGKRLRPALLLAFYGLSGHTVEDALPFACAVEMVHAYSLVHDDLPCMDNSPLRRGKPSAHAAFGEAMALLAGDALLNRAFETMLAPENALQKSAIPAENRLAAAYELARASGIDGMVGGQVMDLQSEGKEIGISVLQRLQKEKTAALIAAACAMGCLLAGGTADQLAAARQYGLNLGLCFQVADDILDVTATAEELGKPAGSDSRNDKSTYPGLLGLGGARALAREYTDAAAAALEPFGEAAVDLRILAENLLGRKN